MVTLDDLKMCYFKLKKYYYDNNGILYYKKKIAEFESLGFNEKLNKLYNNFNTFNERYFNNLLKKTDVFMLSKNAYYKNVTYKNVNKKGNKKREHGKTLDFKINYFVDVPVEIMILDVLFVCEFSKYLNDETANAYRYNNLIDFDINSPYEDNRLFKYYMSGYNNWKKESKKMASDKSTVFKTDIENCYYRFNPDYDLIVETSNESEEIIKFIKIYKKISEIYSYNIIPIDNRVKKPCLPVGLLSSHIIFDFFIRIIIDEKIKDYNDLYLYRYCDDLIFVFKDKNINKEEILEELKDIFYYDSHNNIIIRNTDLRLKYNKTLIKCFNKEDSYNNYNLNMLFKKNSVSDSNIIEYELNERPKYDSNGNEIDTNILYKAQKIRSIYLPYWKLDESDRKIDVNDELIKQFSEEAFRLFNSYKLINYRGSWILLFEYLLLISNNNSTFVDSFYESGIKTIDKKAKYKKINNENLNFYLNRELAIAYDIAKASFDIKTTDNKKYIKTSMFKPLESKIEDKQLLVETKELCPYYISYDEKTFLKCKDPWIEELNDESPSHKNLKYSTYKKDNNIIRVTTILKDNIDNKIGVAVANIKITKEEIKDDLKYDIRSCEARKSFLDLLNTVKQNYKKYNVKYLLFPEFYLDYNWIIDLIKFCKETGITIISGMMLKKRRFNRKLEIVNNLYYFIPYDYNYEDKKYRRVFINKRQKNNYSPEEEENFIGMNAWYNLANKEYHLIKINSFIFTPILCYEFTSPYSRNIFRGVVDAIFVPEVNKDTKYFSSIVHSTSRDNHVFVIQANSSIYGDTRITQPKSTEYMDLVSVKGGNNITVHFSELDLEGLKKIEMEFEDKKSFYKNNINNKKKRKFNDKNKFKIPSADFKRITFDEFLDIINGESNNRDIDDNDLPF